MLPKMDPPKTTYTKHYCTVTTHILCDCLWHWKIGNDQYHKSDNIKLQVVYIQ